MLFEQVFYSRAATIINRSLSATINTNRMPGSNTDSEFHTDGGIDGGEMSSTRSDDPSFPAMVVSALENSIARLEDKVQNSSPLHMEIQNKHGNSIAPKVVFEGDEEKQLHFAKANDINHQEWKSFQQGGEEEDNAAFMSNLDDLDNGLTEKDYTSEAIDQNSLNMTFDTATDIVEDVCNGLLNKRNVMKSLRISEETSNPVGKKMELSKFIDSHVLQTEKAISEIQHVDSGDPHLGTSRLGCLATSSPENIPPKNGASRVLRRASLILIPPHGANRFTSSFMSCESSRVRSLLFPTGGNRFLSVTSAGDCTKTQICKEQQVDFSNHLEESCTLMVEESSKAGQGFHLQTGVIDNKQYCEETQSGLKNTMAEDAHIEVKAKKRHPTNNIGQQDAVMIDSMPSGFYYLKNPNHKPDEPQVFQNEMEVQHVDEKGIQRDFKIDAEINGSFSNHLVQSEAKGKRVHSKFKNDYKKLTDFRKFRNMDNLARISSMREGILARRRSSCVVSASVNHICSSQKGGDDSTGAAVVDRTEGNAKNNQSKMKIPVFGKKRFLEKALIDSAKRLQAQKMLRSGVYDGLAVPKEETEVNSSKEDNFSKEVNQTPLNIVKCESESYGERFQLLLIIRKLKMFFRVSM
ncbi:hypothetical protein SUGI_0102860 [Cryptomeria japonica]|nr:hypothetical protein SUGI_0102860 [Cryptomeria japonica]